MTHPPWMTDEPKLRTWQRRTEWPLTGLAVLFLVCYAVQVLYVSTGRAAAARRPQGPVRPAHVVALLNRQLMHSVHRRVAVYTTGATALIGLAASLAVLDAERDAPGSSGGDADERRHRLARTGGVLVRAHGRGIRAAVR